MQDVIKNNHVAINWDWIECTLVKASEPQPTQRFQLQLYPRSTSIWRVIENGREVAKITSLKGKGQDYIYTLKLENFTLYQEDVKTYLIELIENLGFKFKNYTRLDIAGDFQQTNIKATSPQQFLERIASKKYVLKGKKFVSHDGIVLDEKKQQSQQFELPIPTAVFQSRTMVETITWSKRKSGCQITMYNKTKRYKTDPKPWQNQYHTENGFLPNYDIYRLEFSTKKQETTLCNYELKNTTDTHSEIEWKFYDFADINLIDKHFEYFKLLYTRHFHIAKYESGKQFCRMKPIELLDIKNLQPTKKVRLTKKQAATNMVKSFINRLSKISNNKASEFDISTSFVINNIIYEIVDNYCLHNWFADNITLPEIIPPSTLFYSTNTKMYHTEYFPVDKLTRPTLTTQLIN